MRRTKTLMLAWVCLSLLRMAWAGGYEVGPGVTNTVAGQVAACEATNAAQQVQIDAEIATNAAQQVQIDANTATNAGLRTDVDGLFGSNTAQNTWMSNFETTNTDVWAEFLNLHGTNTDQYTLLSDLLASNANVDTVFGYWAATNTNNRTDIDNQLGTSNALFVAIDGSTPMTGGLANDALGTNYFLGPVGIGTNEPAVPLHVLGNTRLDGDVAVTGKYSGDGAGLTNQPAQAVLNFCQPTNEGSAAYAMAHLACGEGWVLTNGYFDCAGGTSVISVMSVPEGTTIYTADCAVTNLESYVVAPGIQQLSTWDDPIVPPGYVTRVSVLSNDYADLPLAGFGMVIRGME